MNYNRHAGALAVLTTLMVCGFGSHAFADKPAAFSFSVTFTDLNPCTGTPHDITIFLDVYEHQEHNNNFVGRVVRTGFTSDGFEMFAGGERFILNNNVVVSSFRDMWRSEDGRMFTANGRFMLNFNQGQVKVDRFELRCIGDDTILP